jgi:hypothetical protein
VLKLGIGTAVISPKSWDKLTIDGMGRRIPIRGVLEDLGLQVFVLQEKDEIAVICVLDQLFITEAMATNITLRTKERLPQAHLILCARHVHSATAIAQGDGDNLAAESCAATLEIIYEGFSQALGLALQDLREVEVAAARIPVPVRLGLNRRAKLGNGTCITAWDNGALIPPGQKYVGPSSDDAKWIDLLAFREPGRAEPHALLSSYPSHVHFYEVPYFTDEAAGAARRAMKQQHPHLTLMYALGCCGNIALGFAHPIPGNDEETRIAWYKEKSKAYGEAFAGIVSDALGQLSYAPVNQMNYTSHRQPGTERDQDLQIETLRLGPHAICVIPGEIFIEFDADLRRGAPSESLLVMTYNRSFLGYVATALGFEEGSYETIRGTAKETGYLTPTERVKSDLDTGDAIVAKAREQLETLFQN